MIAFHGTPISGAEAIVSRILLSRFAFVSFARPDQLELVSEVCAGFALDNGAFSFWSRGEEPDWELYRSWVFEWYQHPAFQFALIPDEVEGGEDVNDELLRQYPLPNGVPVYHQGERLERLERLVASYERVALASVERYIPSDTFWSWIGEVMAICCDAHGRPRCKLHGLRMLNPEIFERLPLASADSTNLARNCNHRQRWSGRYVPVGAELRGLVMRDRIESFQSPCRYEKATTTQPNFF